MKCFFCKGDMIESTTTRVVEIGNCVVVIKNVPCLKCDQCGEAFINDEIAARLEQMKTH